MESVGSVINDHGYAERSRMTPKHLSDEIFVAYNGPPKYSSQTAILLKQALNRYFANKPLHLNKYFYKNNTKGNLYVCSSTVTKILKKKSTN